MDSKIATIVLLALAVLGWVFVVVVLAEPTSILKMSKGDGGCGVFNCKDDLDLGKYCDIESKVAATKAFGVISVLFLSMTMIVHIIQAVGQGALVPAAVQPYIKFVHLIAAVFLLIFWVLMVIVYTSECDNRYYIGTVKISDLADINYGVFFGVIVMIFEILNFFLCKMGGTDCDSGCASLI